ncbi:hypothetical protein BgiMline_019194 [Biomphalaria glabrata]
MDVQKVGRRPAFSNSSCFSWGGVDSVMCQLAIVLRSASWERDREDLRGLLRTLDEVLKSWRDANADDKVIDDKCLDHFDGQRVAHSSVWSTSQVVEDKN